MNRVLICGSNGLVGQRLALVFGYQSNCEVLNTSHHRNFVLDHHLFDYTQLDITNRSDVKSLVGSFRPDVIINAAAMANVDQCEREREAAWHVNVTGVGHLVEVARRIGAKLIHISTDYVFDGKSGPYREGDRVNPLGYYGKSKLAGENVITVGDVRHAIIRTILIYGSGINVKNNFALWVINNLRAGRTIQCATDQRCSPTFVGDVAGAVVRIIERDAEGLFHVSGSDLVNRFEFAMKTATIFDLDRSLIHPCLSAALMQQAQRPLVTGFVLAHAHEALSFVPMNTEDGLYQMRREMDHVTLN
ncbi:MAG: NAD(P)-dependent oxidoreductase [Ignavibacteriales bacterium]|nr:NAD(P)-dependent oxidoreductase [Ignavibacteriales bacterium]